MLIFNYFKQIFTLRSNQRIADTPPSFDEIEWEIIQKSLTSNHFNISKTAKQLGMHRRTLQRKLKKNPYFNS
ncbi:MAG: helix-turn-helix domain-containing protein [Candidatus Marinamargulisbacteria bacterium]